MSEILSSYTIKINDIVVDISIELDVTGSNVPNYISSIANISDMTKIILEKIREEFISNVNLGKIHFDEDDQIIKIRERFTAEVEKLLNKYFPDTDKRTHDMLMNYIISQDLGLGDLEILLQDDGLEEIVVNSAKEPVWVYHRKHGWCKTNIEIQTEKQIRHYATMIGRDVNKELTSLSPLMDAHLASGDRINATLSPISTQGNTMTIRKFAKDPWTITDFLRTGTINYTTASLIWLAIENEMSVLIVGGTGSGKTSMLNVLANFFPPTQRVISIEDTRELQLPENLHWVPMETRNANPEGKGEVTMLQLLVNSLRMRPDRIIVGEIRRKEEAEILLEAMHTGHSVYGTFHANTADEAIVRMTNPPIGIPKQMLSSVSLFLVQNRNRRTGKRNTFQVAEVLEDGSPNILMQYNPALDKIQKQNDSKLFMKNLKLFTGMTQENISDNLAEKQKILRWLVDNNIRDVNKIGEIMAKYYHSQNSK